MDSSPSPQRLFFALWPDAALQQRWSEGVRPHLLGIDGRLVAVSSLHLTLAFLGSVTAERQRCIEAVASEVRVGGFSLVMDRLGYWRRARVVWLGPGRTPAGLRALVRQLEVGVAGCGFEPSRQGFRAHVTLMRQASCAPKGAVFEPLEWCVDRFVLVASQLTPEGARYRVIREWPLARNAG